MRKLFFFRSPVSSNGSIPAPSSKTEKQEGGSRKPAGSALRRSRSMSSAAFGKHKNFSGLSDQNRSPSSNLNGTPDQKRHYSSRCQTPPLGRQCREKQFQTSNNDYGPGMERPCSAASSRSYYDSSGNSSTCSSNVSTKILDRYIDDGEQQQEWSRHQHNIPPRSYPGNKNDSGRRPPQVQYTAPTLPKYSIDGKPMTHPSEEFQSSDYHLFPGKCADEGYESPRTIAKNVIERLSQSYAIPKTSRKELVDCMPNTIREIPNRTSRGYFDSNSDAVPQKFYSMNEPSEAIHSYNMDNFGFDGQTHMNHCELSKLVETEDAIDEELWRRTKEAEERVILLTEELDKKIILEQGRVGVADLIQIIRHITEEKVNLALEVLRVLQSQITDRASAKEEVRLVKEKLESQTKKLDREKNELQSELEKELDRRSSEWSIKLEKYKLEEQKLRQRVRELAEQNVSLQREVSSFNERDVENRSIISNSEQKIKDLAMVMDKLQDENQILMQNLSEMQEKYSSTKEDRDFFKRNFEEKEKECKELYKSTTRLTRMCCDQQKTINGLQERFTHELGKKQDIEKFDKHVAKLQMEQVRLTGVELSLRRELESCRVEIDSLRHENINLLNRLKDSRNDGVLTFKLDEEMLARVSYLQHQGLTLLNESSQLGGELLEFIKEKFDRVSESMQGLENMKNNLDGLYFIESEMKVQGLKRGTESLKRSLQMVSSLLHEKSNLSVPKVPPECVNADGSTQLNCHSSEHVIKSELRAEVLLTGVLREKLYSKELEIEQLQAEIATAVRGNHILRCELQNAMDNISCITHRLKDLELQILKKDENMARLQNDLEESTTELAIMRGTVPKISEERDLMWDQVKQYSENNMLLNSEAGLLKKKIEALEEDILVREGQITILKDSMRNKSFDLLGNIESADEFLIR